MAANIYNVRPGTVKDYPAAKTNLFNKRKDETKRDLAHGSDIINDMKKNAKYWEGKAPYLSALYADSGVKVALEIRNYTLPGNEKDDVTKLGKELAGIMRAQIALALECPTQEIVGFARNNKANIYKGDVKSLNGMELHLHKVSEAIKSDELKQLLITLNGIYISTCQLIYTGTAGRKDIPFANYFSENRIVRDEKDLYEGEIKVKEFADALDKYVNKQVQAKWNETRQDKDRVGFLDQKTGSELREVIMEGRKEEFGMIGKMVAVMKEEYSKFHDGVLNTIHLPPQKQISLQNVRNEFDRLAKDYVRSWQS